tara:strand:+ start:924 stop:1457 length:534 start_codon:yes stop_codon:yes gene_type:complete
MTDMTRAPNPHKLLSNLPANSALILRHPEPETLRKLAVAAIPVAKKLGHRILIAGYPRLAFATGADGVHIPEALFRKRPNIKWAKLSRRWIVTVSAHSLKTISQAKSAEADAVLLSPVLRTRSHVEARSIGFLRFSQLCRAHKISIYALGGITRNTIRQLKNSKCAGIAGISIFLSD